jgi:hypothetical protein
MTDKNDVSRCLASLAVFRELYDSANQDVYAILAEFLKNIIHLNSLRLFSLNEITSHLNDAHNFSIPASLFGQG